MSPSALCSKSRAKLNDTTVVASISGGKDSAALSLWLTENEIEHVRVFADTGWEHDWTYQYLRGPLTAKLGKIHEVIGRDGGMANLIRRKKMFPSRLRRYCTEEAKVKPLIAFMQSIQDQYGETISAVGIRASESEARSRLLEWEHSAAFDCDVWRPLIAWSEQDVIDIHRRHGLAPNPLYLAGAERVGCWPCIFARKKEIRLVAELSPERIEEIRRLEAELPPNPVTDEHPEPTPRTYFHGKTTRIGTPHPIDEVVEWSKTSFGGTQYELIDSEPAGCVRWGLCESTSEVRR